MARVRKDRRIFGNKGRQRCCYCMAMKRTGCPVHRAMVIGTKSDVVVKVQHPGVEELMMTDIHNLQSFALYLQKTDINFDLYSVTKEMKKQALSGTYFVLTFEPLEPFIEYSDF
ncbi:hypothetical protein Ancab_011006 [Ancistrocladus abbreviatus]